MEGKDSNNCLHDSSTLLGKPVKIFEDMQRGVVLWQGKLMWVPMVQPKSIGCGNCPNP